MRHVMKFNNIRMKNNLYFFIDTIGHSAPTPLPNISPADYL